jgi:leucyl aminopeptidase (aminopeptidase T)
MLPRLSVARLLPHARAILEGALELRPGAEVLIVSDDTVSADLVGALRHAAVAVGLRPSILTHEPLASRGASTVFATSRAGSPDPLPAALSSALTSARAIVLATSGVGVIIPSRAFKEALGAGARACSLSYLLKVEDAFRLLPASVEEVHELRARSDRGTEIMERGRRARVTSPAGTDLTCVLGQYRGLTHNGVIAPGWRQILPAGQVTRVPDDGSAEGVLIIDRSIGADDFKELPEPVRLVIRHGYVTSVEGGAEAERLRRWLEEREDREMYHVTELAFGTNHRCRLTGKTAPSEDTHTAGCVSFALGADVHIGGSTSAPAHVDMTMRYATLELDGNVVVREGALAY